MEILYGPGIWPCLGLRRCHRTLSGGLRGARGFTISRPRYSSHTFSNLTAEEINGRTLKAAAAIDRSRRGRTQGPRAELKVPLTKQVMETDAEQIALFEYRNGTLPPTLDEVATSTHESVKFSMRDAWNDKLKYVPQNNGHFQLMSAGPDKVFGTSDDIQETF